MSEPTVYIVDDDPDMRDSLRWLMKTVGLRAQTFASASEFLRDFTPNGPGCVILDVRMPGTSGLDLFEELATRGEGLPVIFITAYADVPMAVRAMKRIRGALRSTKGKKSEFAGTAIVRSSGSRVVPSPISRSCRSAADCTPMRSSSARICGHAKIRSVGAGRAVPGVATMRMFASSRL